MGEGDTLINAVIGAVVTVVLSFTAVSPILGGAVAGYLQRGDRSRGIRVGAIAGVLAALPFVALVFLVFGVFLSVGFMGRMGGPFAGAPGVAGGFGFVGLVFLLFALAYSVGLSALGGYVGSYLASETEVGGTTRASPPTN